MGNNAKPRETDPIKLVLERGLNQEKRWTPILDEEGQPTGAKEKRMSTKPLGIVLGPVQTMVLAKYILQLNAVADMALADAEEETDEA